MGPFLTDIDWKRGPKFKTLFRVIEDPEIIWFEHSKEGNQLRSDVEEIAGEELLWNDF